MLNIIKRLKTVWSNHGSIIRTIFYNFKYLSLKDAINLPITIGKNTHIKGHGEIVLSKYVRENPHIYIGCKSLDWVDKYVATVFSINGTLKLDGNVFIGSGCKFEIADSAYLTIKEGVVFTGLATVICKKEIEFEQHDLISWDTLFLDSDAHTLYSSNGEKNFNDKIYINENVWIGAKTTVLKGTHIAKNCVVASNSVVKGNFNVDNCLIAGNISKVIKQNIKWNMDMPD